MQTAEEVLDHLTLFAETAKVMVTMTGNSKNLTSAAIAWSAWVTFSSKPGLSKISFHGNVNANRVFIVA